MRFFKIFFLYLKRLYCRKSFFFMIMLLPVLVVAIRATSSVNDGIMRIAVFCPSDSVDFEKSLEKGLEKYSDIIHFERIDSADDAREMVRTREVEAAWIFDSDISKKIRSMMENGRLSPVVKVYQSYESRKSTVSKLSKEILAGSIFKDAAYDAYVAYIRQNLHISADEVSDKKLEYVFEKMKPDRKMIALSYPDDEDDENISYLMAPVRGMMAIWLLACAFIAAIYTVIDEKNGLFGGVDRRIRRRMSIIEGMSVLLNAAVVFILGLLISGIYTAPLRELVSLFLYLVAVSGVACFSTVISRGNLSVLCILMIVWIIASIALSPVIAGIRLPQVQWLIPANMYLRGTHSRPYIIKLAIFDVALIGIAVIRELGYTTYRRKFFKSGR